MGHPLHTHPDTRAHQPRRDQNLLRLCARGRGGGHRAKQPHAGPPDIRGGAHPRPRAGQTCYEQRRARLCPPRCRRPDSLGPPRHSPLPRTVKKKKKQKKKKKKKKKEKKKTRRPREGEGLALRGCGGC